MLPRCLALLRDIEPNHLHVIRGMLAGKTLSDMAKEQKKPMQNLHAAWKREIKLNPVLFALKNGMVGKGIGRKPGCKTNASPHANRTKQKPNTSKKVIASAVSSLSKDQRASVLAYISQLAKGCNPNGSTTSGITES